MVSRKKRFVVNFTFSVLKFILHFLFTLFIRYGIILYLGVQYLGLSSLFSNILSILSLAEAGFGTALVFSMYKPMAENDTKKVNALLNLYKKYYRIISCVVLAVGLLITPLLPVMVNNDSGLDINIYILYAIYLINILITYFNAHRRALLLTDQHMDIETKISTITSILLSLTQFALLFLFKNYYIYIGVMPLFTLFDSLLVYFVTNKKYSHIIKENEEVSKEEKKLINKNVYSMFFHRVGGVVLTSTDSILISLLFGISILGIYSNYLAITTAITSAIFLIINAIRGGLGNLIAKEDKEYVRNTYSVINFGINWIVAFTSICFLCLIQHFIKMWMGEEYMLSESLAFLMSIYLFIGNGRQFNYTFKESCGLFWQNRYAPLIEVTINLFVSLLLGKLIGVEGVIIGTIVSCLFVPFWVDRLMVYRHYFKSGLLKYWYNYFYYVLVSVIAGAVTYFICSLLPSYGLVNFIYKMLICLTVPNIILLLGLVFTKDFKNCWNFGLNWLKKNK